MSTDAGRPRAFGGGQLQGARWVRIIYVDEAGTSANDPVVVVGGIIINADQQWRALEQKVAVLIEKHVPEDRRTGFVFHGKELFSGGKNFPRENEGGISKEERWQILEEVVLLPREVQLPIVIGHWPAIRSVSNPKGAAIVGQSLAYSMCLIAANGYLNALTDPDDIAHVVAENNDVVKRHLKRAHKDLQRMDDPKMPEVLRAAGPINKIKDAVHFAEKSEAILLQIADACSFVTARYLGKKPDSERFFDMMVGSCPVAGRETKEGAGHFTLAWGTLDQMREAYANNPDKALEIFPIEGDD